MDRKEAFRLAKAAETAGCFREASHQMVFVAYMNPDLNLAECLLFSKSCIESIDSDIALYKQLTGEKWGGKPKSGDKESMLKYEYLKMLETQLPRTCLELLDQINDSLLPRCTTTPAKLIYYKVKSYLHMVLGATLTTKNQKKHEKQASSSIIEALKYVSYIHPSHPCLILLEDAMVEYGRKTPHCPPSLYLSAERTLQCARRELPKLSREWRYDGDVDIASQIIDMLSRKIAILKPTAFVSTSSTSFFPLEMQGARLQPSTSSTSSLSPVRDTTPILSSIVESRSEPQPPGSWRSSRNLQRQQSRASQSTEISQESYSQDSDSRSNSLATDNDFTIQPPNYQRDEPSEAPPDYLTPSYIPPISDVPLDRLIDSRSEDIFNFEETAIDAH